MSVSDNNVDNQKFKELQNDVLGRYAVAARNLEADELIHEELPFVVGPKSDSRVVCLGQKNIFFLIILYLMINFFSLLFIELKLKNAIVQSMVVLMDQNVTFVNGQSASVVILNIKEIKN